jgi:hypothetical protein
VVTSAVGGTASIIGGGKFANGAVAAAYGYLFNWAIEINLAVIGGTFGIGEESHQRFNTFRAGWLGFGASYDPHADIPKGASGEFAAQCQHCSVDRVAWEQGKFTIFAIEIGPLNLSTTDYATSQIVKEYHGDDFVSATGNDLGSETKNRVRDRSSFGIRIQPLRSYYEWGWSRPWNTQASQ